ncbi:Rieske (2Fe-2S) protein [Dactylosporangium siamense]|uniref:Cytochrome bc1 complex Rieske iron-sulfur subunit n=1 Tax=Dactylosporangium siamense TaxID=685454 RepID=A0A919UBD0_9ACTN|nr:Rieske (2Fe-2S) protein [Dactylosporangium siamense]GIG49374.1 iron-sulfur protein [Dactylosporangium siamense]
MSDTTRRAVLAGAAGITAVTVLAACGDDSDDSGSTGDSSTGGAAAGVLATKADIPVGGGKIFKDGGGVVVTQPEAGKFKAFSSICTHQSCVVSDVAAGAINCRCHGSVFSAADGSVKNGPATKGLAEKSLKVEGDNISLA